MKREDRQAVFEKYEGKCAYCGCELQKSWHVDHMEPIGRRWKIIRGGFYKYKATGERAGVMSVTEANRSEYEWVEDRRVPDGMDNPENDCAENYMPACASCNINKHSMALEDFRDSIAAYMKHLNEVSTQYKIAKRYGLVQETSIEVKFYFETVNELLKSEK